MSRGMGKVERQLLEELERSGSGVWIAGPDMPRSQVESRRRAARSLESKGLAAVRNVRLGRRTLSKLLSMDVARETDRKALRADLADAKEKKRDAASEEFQAYAALSAIEPPTMAQGYEWNLEKNRKRREAAKGPVDGGTLRVRIDGDDRRVAMFLNDLETLLGGIWDFTDPRDLPVRGTQRIEVIMSAGLKPERHRATTM